MNKIFLASSNQGKAKEISDYLHPVILELPDHKFEPEETGVSFQENAFMKAKAYAQEFQPKEMPILADDSGLILEEFPNELGVHSARFRPELNSYDQKCQAVLDLYSSEPKAYTRSAYFVCVLCLYFSDAEYFFFEGRVDGNISDKLNGSEGFGYDPIFIPKDHPQKLSFAQDLEFKKSHSHRLKALETLRKFTKTRI